MEPPPRCWSSLVKNPPPPQQPQQPPSQPPKQLQQPPSQPLATPNPTTARTPSSLPAMKSRQGISTAVVDANAVIEGGEKLHGLADRFVTVPEVLSEIRDPVSRLRLSFTPFSILPMDPTPDSLHKVIKFARATGDLQTLSDVDLKLIALTYTLEAQAHGTRHLRDAPPPVHTVDVRRLPENDMPGWGNNVPNLEEWEALEREGGGGEEGESRILPSKDISLNVEVNEENGSVAGNGGSEDVGDNGGKKGRRYPVKKGEVKVEGKKMVADGMDASNGELGEDAGDWMPAVSRSTHRRYLRRKARREYYKALLEKESQQDAVNGDNGNAAPDELVHQSSEAVGVVNGMSEEGGVVDLENASGDLSHIFQQMRLEESSLQALQEGEHEENASMEIGDDNARIGVEANDADAKNGELDHEEIVSQTSESFDASQADDDGDDESERSWTLRSLLESSVACVTSDFAMQNVLLQMGLRLLAPGGNQIHQLHRWVLKCHACYTVTAEIGRIFCPKCGNGGTLRKVAITVGENGIILAARRPRITLRGTKFSLPLPQGGRDAIVKNPILREDQLPQKFLYPKTKKKANKQGDDFYAVDSIFSHHTDKKAPFRPPVRKALSVFSGKRNPNDNHYAHPKH